VFDALPTLSLTLAAMAGMIRDLTPDAKTMKRAAGAGYATATDLADWLARELKLPSAKRTSSPAASSRSPLRAASGWKG